ncbi:MAG: hypothetical protein U5N86_07150 [Planctomycetota bacterium]|nr:hypothetical protein [Planctomycetota bacterium]
MGILVEGAGDDTYYGNIYSQGCAYWWSLGICEDFGGNDSYRCLWYSLGSAPHFAIGCMVDNEGDDSYNMDAKDAYVQYQGCARDGSMAVFIDGDGNDQYYLRNRCGGAGDLGSIAVFWDRFGDDLYHVSLKNPYGKDLPLGGERSNIRRTAHSGTG